ncbi:hypothetical protein MP228_006870 [Amoeboaphelidium protococcarum]|nr:hypothetical protein MP228_006870 [Amoeboaphelidium protococcarum]
MVKLPHLLDQVQQLLNDGIVWYQALQNNSSYKTLDSNCSSIVQLAICTLQYILSSHFYFVGMTQRMNAVDMFYYLSLYELQTVHQIHGLAAICLCSRHVFSYLTSGCRLLKLIGLVIVRVLKGNYSSQTVSPPLEN